MLAGVTVEDARIRNQTLMPDEITPHPAGDETQSMLRIPPGGVVGAEGRVAGILAGDTKRIEGPTTGLIEWDRRRVRIETTIGDPDGHRVELELFGRIPNLLPEADAGADQTLECTDAEATPVNLSGADSTDPDGSDDLRAFRWLADLGEGSRQVGRGAEADVLAPLGETRFTLSVSDRLGATDFDSTDVSVVDTAKPQFDAVELDTECLWPPDHDLHLLRLGREIRATVSDACHGPVGAIEIVDVESSEPDDDIGDGQTAPDVRFGSGAVCLRSERGGVPPGGRVYTITLRATDPSGNTQTIDVPVRVPHDERPSTRCDSGREAPAVRNGDPRCVASADLPPSGSSLSATAPSATATPSAPTGPDAGAAAEASSASGGCSAAAPEGGRGVSAASSLGLVLVATWLWRRRRREHKT